MAKETLSEKLVSESNKYYLQKNKAKIKKIDAKVTIVRGRAIFSRSTGLDFEGILQGGIFTTFEVKETEKEYIPIDNIRMSQSITAERQTEFGVEPFLLVYFKRIKEWYLISFNLITKVINEEYTSIPLRFFQAFGKMVPILDRKIGNNYAPNYLNPESHPLSNDLKKGYPKWMPKNKKNKSIKTEKIKIDHTDSESRKERIKKAIKRGTENARKREINVSVYKKGW